MQQVLNKQKRWVADVTQMSGLWDQSDTARRWNLHILCERKLSLTPASTSHLGDKMGMANKEILGFTQSVSWSQCRKKKKIHGHSEAQELYFLLILSDEKYSTFFLLKVMWLNRRGFSSCSSIWCLYIIPVTAAEKAEERLGTNSY